MTHHTLPYLSPHSGITSPRCVPGSAWKPPCSRRSRRTPTVTAQLEPARHLETFGVSWFGVATAEEALELRAGGVTGRIIIFTPVYRGLEELIDQDITLSVFDTPQR